MSEVVVPSSNEDRKKLKMMLGEMVNQLQKIDMEKETFKELGAEIKRQFNLPPKVVNKMAKTMYKHDFEDVKEEHESFENLYEVLVKGRNAEENA